MAQPEGLAKGGRVYGGVRDEVRRRSGASGRQGLRRGRGDNFCPSVRAEAWTYAVLQLSGARTQGFFVH